MHLDGPHIWNGIGFEGVTLMMMKGGSQGSSWNGHYLVSLGGVLRQTMAREGG